MEDKIEPMELIIDTLCPGDWDAARAIYEEGMATGHATFETQSPSWEEWNTNHLQACRLAARQNGKLVGWAALSLISLRQVYSGVAEVSIYVTLAARGQGIGKQLLTTLVKSSEQIGIWTLQAVIMAENEPSTRLHINCGFREVGRRERIAQRDGIWHDTIILERRSRVVGI